jgi:hypothetical protein
VWSGSIGSPVLRALVIAPAPGRTRASSCSARQFASRVPLEVRPRQPVREGYGSCVALPMQAALPPCVRCERVEHASNTPGSDDRDQCDPRRPDARFALGDAGTSVVWAGLSTIVPSRRPPNRSDTLARRTTQERQRRALRLVAQGPRCDGGLPSAQPPEHSWHPREHSCRCAGSTF